MPALKKEGSTVFLRFSEKEAEGLGLEEGKEYSLHRAKKGAYLLLEEKETRNERNYSEADENIAVLLETLPFGERVEGKFERHLNAGELERFGQLLDDGRVERYKSNQKYVKSLYRKAGPGNRKEPGEAGRRRREEERKGEMKAGLAKTLPKGFLSTPSEQEAREKGGALEEEKKQGLVMGIKDFDGTYYLFEQEAFNLAAEKLRKAFEEEKSISLEKLAEKTGLDKPMVKGACAIMKEEGDIMEKKQEQYTYIG